MEPVCGSFISAPIQGLLVQFPEWLSLELRPLLVICSVNQNGNETRSMLYGCIAYPFMVLTLSRAQGVFVTHFLSISIYEFVCTVVYRH